MSKTYVISDEDKKILEDVQVAFTLNQWRMVEVQQVQIYCKFCGDYQNADLAKFSPLRMKDLEQICADWFNEQDFSENYSNDDLNPPPRAA